jgi:tRNA (guanine-N7-)-methyltransferase
MSLQSSPPPDPLAQAGDGERRRRIRSFVRREGRFTPAQQRGFAQHWTRYGLDAADGPPDWSQVFSRTAPLVLEIGFGNGEQLLWSAGNEPERNFIGIEVHRPGVGRLMNALAVDNVNNVRLYNHDAVDVLDRIIGEAALSEVRIYFPDPWPKKRQQKRRLIQPEFVTLLAARVATGGRLHLATDWAEYAEHMLAVLDASVHWRNLAGMGTFSLRPPTRIETHFERRGVRLGHGVWDLLYERS